MMKCFITYYEQCKKILLESQKNERKISMATIEESLALSVIAKLKEMKRIHPDRPDKEIVKELDSLAESIENEFRKLAHG